MYYKSTIELVVRYHDIFNNVESVLDGRLTTEVYVRLRQLSYLYDLIISDNATIVSEDEVTRPPVKPGDVVHSTIMHMSTIASPGSKTGLFAISERLNLNLEAFYYVAHRIRKLLQTSGGRLPCKRTFECLSIARTRNHLIEHPNKKAGTETSSLCVSNQGGPFLKAAKRDDEVYGYRDKGFMHNSEDFRSALNNWFLTELESANS